jgi:hypothetical protein
MHGVERTQAEITRATFDPVEGDDREALATRVSVLTSLVFDLMAEVEALRQAHVSDAAYRAAYRDVGLLTHNSAGPSAGWQKLLARYYPERRFADGRVWRESVMLQRLGFTPDEIAAFQQQADEMEQYT